MVRVDLTSAEVMSAAQLGVMRHTHALFKGSREAAGMPNDGWGAHIEGAAGEIAVSKYLGVYPGFTLNTYKAPDVSGMDVRVRSEMWHDMKILPSDEDERVFIMVVGRSPVFHVVGWIRGRDGKKAEYFKDLPNGRGKAYWVPKADLQPISTLPRVA